MNTEPDSEQFVFDPPPPTKFNFLSLGAGVQSSVMALMAARGDIKPTPDAAIFADTQAEPDSVYRWLDWLEDQLPFPVIRVSGGNLTDESLKIRISKKTGLAYISHSIPAFTRNQDNSKGNYFRQCTDKHKLTPLKKAIDSMRLGQDATVWIGISWDEIQRMKESQRKGVQHRWPLIELRFTRQDCLEWMDINGYPKPPRSACVYCPYHSDQEWLRLKTEEPEAFAKAVEYENLLQKAATKCPRLTGIPFLHVKRIPLDQVVFDGETKPSEHPMQNECEGMCGV